MNTKCEIFFSLLSKQQYSVQNLKAVSGYSAVFLLSCVESTCAEVKPKKLVISLVEGKSWNNNDNALFTYLLVHALFNMVVCKLSI